MNLKSFYSTLETFALDLQQSGDAAGYANAVITLINDFRSDEMQKSKEQLINEMLEFCTTVRSAK